MYGTDLINNIFLISCLEEWRTLMTTYKKSLINSLGHARDQRSSHAIMQIHGVPIPTSYSRDADNIYIHTGISANPPKEEMK